MPNTVRRMPPPMTVEEFLVTDQARFGRAWRYELVDGHPVAQSAPSPDHAAIVMNIGVALHSRLKGTPCRAESGSAAIPRDRSKDRARIPDAMVRCVGIPKVLFEVISPEDDKSKVAKAERYNDLRNVEGVFEIIEIEQDEFLCRIHRWRAEIDGWQLDYVSGKDAFLHLASIGVDIPLADLFENVAIPESRDGATGEATGD